jgi:AmmeMemoRadiSam system protein B
MVTRPPAVAGAFYELDPKRLRAQVAACFAENPKAAAKQNFIGAVVPHAGLMYSGHVAAAFYGLAELPKRFFILCPNHTGYGHFAAINRDGAWRTPLGDVKIDTPLADALMAKTKLLADDPRAHAREHSLEVQLPFLQDLLGNDFTFVPICLGAPRYEMCEEIGLAIAADRYQRLAGTIFGLLFATGLCGGMLFPWLVGHIGQSATLRSGMAVPFVGALVVCTLAVIQSRH